MVLMLFAASGCTDVRVYIDARLASDNTLWHHLDGPTYVIRGGSPEHEASLSFEAFSDMLAEALAAGSTSLRRVHIGEPADLSLTLLYELVDRGTDVETYPVYGPSFGYWYGCGPGPYHSTYMGTQSRTVHLGYRHLLFVSAWIPAPDQPAGRRTIWEGHSEHVSDRNSLKQTMPYLITALVEFYGKSTSEPVRVTLKRDDPRVERLRRD
jgi:hypothetical protein